MIMNMTNGVSRELIENISEVRVRYSETDQMGVVYYANYLIWFEFARTELFRSTGLDYRSIEEEDSIYLPVIESYCRYKSPVMYDDLVRICTRVTDVGRMKITFEYEVLRDGKIAATGMTKHVFVNAGREPIPVPSKVREVLTGRITEK